MYTYTHIGLFLLFFLCTVTGLFCRCFPLPSLAVTALVFNFLQIVRVRVCVCVRGRYRMLPPIVRGYCVKWGGDSLILVGCCCWGRGGGVQLLRTLRMCAPLPCITDVSSRGDYCH